MIAPLRAVLSLVVAAALFAASPVAAQFADQSTFVPVGAGSANAQTITLPNAASYADIVGVVIKYIPAATNTAAATINLNGFGTKPFAKISQAGVTALTGLEIVTGQAVFFMYDGTQAILLSPAQQVLSHQTKYAASTTWTVPNGTALIYFKDWGAGGGGGGAAGAAGAAGGGGAGGFAEGYLAVTTGDVITITVGTGGAGGTTAGTGGTTGGNSVLSSVVLSTIATATGGIGGAGVSSGAGAGGAGGTASALSGLLTRSGGPGGTGQASGAAGTGGGSVEYGIPTPNIGIGTGAGHANFPGQGANGGASTSAGGAGINGEIIIWN